MKCFTLIESHLQSPNTPWIFRKMYWIEKSVTFIVLYKYNLKYVIFPQTAYLFNWLVTFLYLIIIKAYINSLRLHSCISFQFIRIHLVHVQIENNFYIFSNTQLNNTDKPLLRFRRVIQRSIQMQWVSINALSFVTPRCGCVRCLFLCSTIQWPAAVWISSTAPSGILHTTTSTQAIAPGRRDNALAWLLDWFY